MAVWTWCLTEKSKIHQDIILPTYKSWRSCKVTQSWDIFGPFFCVTRTTRRLSWLHRLAFLFESYRLRKCHLRHLNLARFAYIERSLRVPLHTKKMRCRIFGYGYLSTDVNHSHSFSNDKCALNDKSYLFVSLRGSWTDPATRLLFIGHVAAEWISLNVCCCEGLTPWDEDGRSVALAADS